MENRGNEHSGVQGVLTLNYDCHEEANKKQETTYATQLSAGGENTVVMVELNQQKGLMDNTQDSKTSNRYKISTEKLVSLIKENGEKF